VFRVKIATVVCAARATTGRAQVQGENGMKEATRRAASGAFAHMLAVTAMLVIASILLYGR